MNDPDDDKDDQEEGLGKYTDKYSHWQMTWLQLGHSKQEFWDWWDDLCEEENQDKALKEVYFFLNKFKLP